MKTRSAGEARTYFPRGLYQPPGSYRFALDALLLGALAARCRGAESGDSLLDLGCGCGAAGFAAALLTPFRNVTGLELLPELAAAAGRNASALGLGEIYRAVECDLEDLRSRKDAASVTGNPEGFAVVAANPPYRSPERGRVPASAARRAALFAGPGTLEAFCRAAALSLKPEGIFCAVYPFERGQELLSALERHGLFPERLVPVQTSGALPSLLLAECGFAPASPAPQITPPLRIHENNTARRAISRDALDFCPFLACNRGDANLRPKD